MESPVSTAIRLTPVRASSANRFFAKQPFRRETGDGAVAVTKGGTIYKLESVLGVGGLSVVYMATRYGDRETVALKLPRSNVRDAVDAAGLLKREARVLSRLSHPNIVRVVDQGETTNGEPFVAMELVRAQTLDVLMTANGGRLPVLRASNICLQLCDALAHAHDRGIIHRDIKPANLLVRTIDGTDKITLFDFGIASIDGDEKDVGDCGSLMYASPEQLENTPCTAASEIYQVALLYFELLAGRLPFDREVIAAVKYRHGDAQLLPSDEDLGPDRALPAAVRELLLQALSPVPHQRPASMNMFGHSLRQIVTKMRMTSLRFATLPETIPA